MSKRGKIEELKAERRADRADLRYCRGELERMRPVVEVARSYVDAIQAGGAVDPERVVDVDVSRAALKDAEAALIGAVGWFEADAAWAAKTANPRLNWQTVHLPLTYLACTPTMSPPVATPPDPDVTPADVEKLKAGIVAMAPVEPPPAGPAPDRPDGRCFRHTRVGDSRLLRTSYPCTLPLNHPGDRHRHPDGYDWRFGPGGIQSFAFTPDEPAPGPVAGGQTLFEALPEDRKRAASATLDPDRPKRQRTANLDSTSPNPSSGGETWMDEAIEEAFEAFWGDPVLSPRDYGAAVDRAVRAAVPIIERAALEEGRRQGWAEAKSWYMAGGAR